MKNMPRIVKVRVFLPVGVCGCSQTDFIARTYQAVRKHPDIVDYGEDSAGSEAAKRAGVTYRGILIGRRLLQGNPTSDQIEEAILAEANRTED
ncbi:MAG: hypothetical protein C4K49_01900 [Candidatus Thorarchaeota archaeon]|nr:MAG: hypothetical protein C4K49_01900 [Candidatus Thorarchaeota archaeon]